MNKLAALIPSLVCLAMLAACGKQEPAPASTQDSAPAQTSPANAQSAAPTEPAAPANEAAAQSATAAPSENAAAENPQQSGETPAEAISETGEDDAAEAAAQTAATSSTTQPALRLGGAATTAPTSGKFREGTHYTKLVPAQPTSVAPGKVEVVEVFWYGCGHCYTLDPAIESWRNKGRAAYVEFVRLPAMWNDLARMHARLFYTAELLGKLEQLHPLIFRELHVNQNPLNTVDKIAAFFKQHGVSREEFDKAFSSFGVESKLQRADMLNRRYRVKSVPLVLVNGKYSTAVSEAGGEQPFFELINELAAHEHGG